MISNDIKVAESALLIRGVEQSLLDKFEEGLLAGTTHTCIGQELIAIALADFVDLDKDFVLGAHRAHGHYLALTGDIDGLLAEVAGLESGICRGRGGSQHLYRPGFLTNGIQGGGAGLSVGIALGLDRSAEKGIVVSILGDGTLGQGLVYESWNLASVLNVPTLFLVEDNGYAQSTRSADVFVGDLRARALGFGLNYICVADDDFCQLSEKVGEAVQHVRSGQGPMLLHVKTRRLMAHSKGDDSRDNAELEQLVKEDPLTHLLQRLPKGEKEALIARINSLIDESWIRVLEEKNAQKQFTDFGGLVEPLPLQQDAITQIQLRTRDRRGFIDSLNDGLRKAIVEQDILVIGEDICDPYGGAFKVTKGLSSDHPKSVLNMPISEAAICALANGFSLTGKKTVVEFMFADFSALAADQVINHAAKFKQMFGSESFAGILIRMATGGWRGYGPTHSQSLERVFMGFGGVEIFAPNSIGSPEDLFLCALESKAGCCIFAEGKSLYPLRSADLSRIQDYKLSRTAAHSPNFALLHQSPNLTRCDVLIISYGEVFDVAFDSVGELSKHGLHPDFVVFEQIQPVTLDIFGTLHKQYDLVIVADASIVTFGFGAEVLALCTELKSTLNFLRPDTSFLRVGGSLVSPASRALEEQLAITSQIFVKTILSNSIGKRV